MPKKNISICNLHKNDNTFSHDSSGVWNKKYIGIDDTS